MRISAVRLAKPCRMEQDVSKNAALALPDSDLFPGYLTFIIGHCGACRFRGCNLHIQARA